MSDPQKFTVGQRVIYTGRGETGRAGVVTRICRGASAEVCWDSDGADDSERVNVGHLRPETQEDIDTRAAVIELEHWRSLRPQVVCTQVMRNWGTTETGLVMVRVSTSTRSPEEMRQAAAELLELAAWFEKRPGQVKP